MRSPTSTSGRPGSARKSRRVAGTWSGRTPGFIAGAAALLLLLPADLRSTLGQDDLAAAEAAAKADAESADGKKYGEALGQAFGREHGSTIQRCAKPAKRPDLTDFDVYVRVDEAGAVDKALVNPATTLATCVRDKLPGWKVPVPPHAGFWVNVAVKLKSK